MPETRTSILSDDLLARCAGRAAAYDRDNKFFVEDFEELKKAGYLIGPVPKELGGLGGTLADSMQETRRLAYHAQATALGLNMHNYWGRAILSGDFEIFPGHSDSVVRSFPGAMTRPRKGTFMPLFIIERNFAEQLELNKDAADYLRRINDDSGVRWLYSFLSSDKKKTYCLYEAPSADAIRAAAKLANIPADVVTPVSELRPEQFA